MHLVAISLLALFSPTGDLRAEEQPPVATGAIASLIGEEIPVAPEGYASLPAVMAAIQTKRENVINVKQTQPGVRASRDVVYGNNSGQPLKLDLYQPRRNLRPKAGLVFIHGGGWKHGSKADYAYYGQVFAAKGYVLASIDYRLSGVAPFPAAVEDCKCAVRWMRAHAEELEIDPQKIFVAGGSAGGHLSLMVAYSADNKDFEGQGGHQEFNSDVAGVVSLYGPTDLASDFVRGNAAFPLVEQFIGKPYSEAPDVFQAASPLTHLDAGDPPTLILHGTIDNLVPVGQSDRLAQQLDELKIPYVYDRLPGWPHAMDLSQRVNDRCVWLMEHFFESVIKNSNTKADQ